MTNGVRRDRHRRDIFLRPRQRIIRTIASKGDDSELRHIDPQSGDVIESLAMPTGAGVSELESDGRDRFFCGGGKSGKVRVVRRPRKTG